MATKKKRFHGTYDLLKKEMEDRNLLEDTDFSPDKDNWDIYYEDDVSDQDGEDYTAVLVNTTTLETRKIEVHGYLYENSGEINALIRKRNPPKEDNMQAELLHSILRSKELFPTADYSDRERYKKWEKAAKKLNINIESEETPKEGKQMSEPSGKSTFEIVTGSVKRSVAVKSFDRLNRKMVDMLRDKLGEKFPEVAPFLDTPLGQEIANFLVPTAVNMVVNAKPEIPYAAKLASASEYAIQGVTNRTAEKAVGFVEDLIGELGNIANEDPAVLQFLTDGVTPLKQETKKKEKEKVVKVAKA